MPLIGIALGKVNFAELSAKIGGVAPSKYLAKIENDGNVQPQTLNSYDFVEITRK